MSTVESLLLWGSSEVSCIERYPHFRGKESIFGIQQSIHNTEVPSFQGCPKLRGVYFH